MSLATLSRPGIETLRTNMVTYLPYPDSLRNAVGDMMAAWEAFCTLPERDKSKFGYTPDTSFSGAGYELKKVEGKADLKEDFHVRRDKREFLYAGASRVNAPEGFQFLDASFAVYDQLDPLIKAFVEEVESHYGLANLAQDAVSCKEHLIIRLLHYFGNRNPGDIFGEQHCDKGGFTGHLYESDSGVERLTRDGRWVPLDVAHGEAAFFPGLGLQHRAKCQLTAPCHRIVANESTAVVGRFSSVCFSDIGNGRHWDKERVGRTQNQPAGFNYRIPFDEFDQFFMD